MGWAHCYKCGYSQCQSALDYHHTNPKTKDGNAATWMQYAPTPARVEKLVKETICLCSRCHRELHAGLWKLDVGPDLPTRGIIQGIVIKTPKYTGREQSVIGLLQKGRTRKEIAQLLGITQENLRQIISRMERRANKLSPI
jgi:DNA-binding NarL/FixJ family response regulator